MRKLLVAAIIFGSLKYSIPFELEAIMYNNMMIVVEFQCEEGEIQ